MYQFVFRDIKMTVRVKTARWKFSWKYWEMFLKSNFPKKRTSDGLIVTSLNSVNKLDLTLNKSDWSVLHQACYAWNAVRLPTHFNECSRKSAPWWNLSKTFLLAFKSSKLSFVCHKYGKLFKAISLATILHQLLKWQCSLLLTLFSWSWNSSIIELCSFEKHHILVLDSEKSLNPDWCGNRKRW